MLGASSPIYSKDKTVCVPAVFKGEAVLGRFGLHPSCQDPLEELSSALSQALVQFLLLWDLSPALRASCQW